MGDMENFDPDIFYCGYAAHDNGLSLSDCPQSYPPKHQEWWRSGYSSAARRKLNPFLPVEDYDRIGKEAEAAYHQNAKTGATTPCPYPDESSEANAIWVTRYMDCERIYGDQDDWVILGTPRQVKHEANLDGTHTYVVIPAAVGT